MTAPTVQWGAWINGSVYSPTLGNAPWDATTWDTFEQHAGKRVSWLHFGQPAPWDQPFAAGPFQDCQARGATPLCDMAIGTATLAQVSQGEHNTDFTAWAEAAKAYGDPILLRWCWEMNGTWFPYGAEAAKDPAIYVAAWRLVHALFADAGATNVKWVWCPNTVFPGSTPLKELYPGDRYVNWLGVDGYNRGTNPLGPSGWQTFQQVFGTALTQLADLSSHPIAVCEIGCTETGGSKAAWIKDMFVQLPKHSRVQAMAWFNWDVPSGSGEWDWPVESSASAQAAFKAGIADPRYIGSSVTPPVPPGPPALPAAPVGPFTQYTTRQMYEDAQPHTLSKIQVTGAPDYGVLLMDWPPKNPPPSAPSTFTDILTENIGPVPPVSGGTAEAGIWLGQLCNAERVWGDGSWEGLWTGCTVGGSIVTDFTCAKMGADGKPSGPLNLVGLYLEHVTIGVKFTNGYLWANGNNGNSEWWYTDSTYAALAALYLDVPAASWAGAGKAGSANNYFKNVSFYCPANGVGMFEDAGTFGNTYDGCYFWGPGAGIGLPNNRLGPLSLVMPNCVFVNKGVNIYYHDNAIGIAKGAAQPGRPLHPHTLRNK